VKLYRFACVVAVLLPEIALAWQIEPIVTPIDQKLVRRAGIVEWIQIKFGSVSDRVMGDPMHESIILRAEGCDLDNPVDCYNARGTLTPGLEPLYGGVQWNDNPPFVLNKSGFKYASGKDASSRCLADTIRLPRLPDCWALAMVDAEKVAERQRIDASYPILYRSHYGDLQFLHGMAASGENAANTQRKMMVWAEFAYKVARGDIPSTMALDKVQIAGFSELISIRERTVESLFTLGDPAFRNEPQINLFALGTLLHMMQDTFSEAHAERGEEGGVCDGSSGLRQPGKLKRFHSYALQDSKKHKTADTRHAFHSHDLKVGNNAVQVTRNLLDFYRKKADWPAVEDYLNCVFRLEPGVEGVEPDAGAGYEK
jgi:hypothetical protein